MRLDLFVAPLSIQSVSIHAPWEGCDLQASSLPSFSARFQFTHPGKGATSNGMPELMVVDVSIHAPWEGCDILGVSLIIATLRFQFTHPGKGATLSKLSRCGGGRVSIHAPWEGCDLSVTSLDISHSCFNSRTLGRVRLCAIIIIVRVSRFQFTHPGKGATGLPHARADRPTFQFTHPGKGATEKWVLQLVVFDVSIHAPWEGCDGVIRRSDRYQGVSIHAPWEGCDVAVSCRVCSEIVFQFTHPGKGATGTTGRRPREARVSIHAPWEGCDTQPFLECGLRRVVSIHAPWEGCDCYTAWALSRRVKFQFTHPGKGATARVCCIVRARSVSIHAPWEGCDYPAPKQIQLCT